MPDDPFSIISDISNTVTSVSNAFKECFSLARYLLDPEITVRRAEARNKSATLDLDAALKKNCIRFINKMKHKSFDPKKLDQIDNNWMIKLLVMATYNIDEYMEILLEAILTEEAEKPGTYSKRTLNVLDNLTRKEAELFKQYLTNSACCDGNIYILWDGSSDTFGSIKNSDMRLLDDCGLVHMNNVGFLLSNRPVHEVFYGNKKYILNCDGDSTILLPSVAALTVAGTEICQLLRNTHKDIEYDYEMMDRIVNSLDDRAKSIQITEENWSGNYPVNFGIPLRTIASYGPINDFD